MISENATLIQNAKIEILNVKIPRIKNNTCRIKVHTAGICSSDIERAFGNGAYFYPLVLGHEVSGKVVECGTNVKGFDIGDRVAVFPLIPCRKCEFCKKFEYVKCNDYKYYGSRCNGGFSTYLDVEEWNLIKLPKEISLEDAALVEPVSVCLHAIKKLNLNSNLDKFKKINLAILGAGFLGLIIADILKYQFPKIQITLIDRNKEKLLIDHMKGISTFHLKNDNNTSFLHSKFENKFTHVVEATGTNQGFLSSLHITKPGGKTLWMGNITSDLHINKNLVSQILRKELSILGTWNSDFKSKVMCDWTNTINLMKKGYRPSKLISHKIKINEIETYLRKMYNHKKRIKKFSSVNVVVDIQNKG